MEENKLSVEEVLGYLLIMIKSLENNTNIVKIALLDYSSGYGHWYYILDYKTIRMKQHDKPSIITQMERSEFGSYIWFRKVEGVDHLKKLNNTKLYEFTRKKGD